MTVISVIVGSTRQGRFSEKPAQWILRHLKNRGGIDARLLDAQPLGRAEALADGGLVLGGGTEYCGHVRFSPTLAQAC